MSAILKVVNPNSELVISSDGYGLYCVGKATLQSLVQPSGSATSDYPGRVAGYSVYRINWPTQVIFAIDAPLNKRAGIISVTQPSSGVWEVTCYCGDTKDAYDFDTKQYAVDVWAYGVPSSPMTGAVFQIFKTDGTLAYDLTRPNPLFPRSYALAAARGNGFTIPSMSRPVLLGFPTSFFRDHIYVSTNRYAYLDNRSVWFRDSATTVKENIVTMRRYEYSATEPRDGGGGSEYFDTPVFTLEGATLP